MTTWEEDDWRIPPFTMTGLLTKSRLSSLEDRLLRLLASVMSERSWGPVGLARAGAHIPRSCTWTLGKQTG